MTVQSRWRVPVAAHDDFEGWRDTARRLIQAGIAPDRVGWSLPGEAVATLTLDCYPELALNQISKMIEQATERFALLGATVIHRYGRLEAGAPIVQVMTLAPHRQAAFEAAEYLMDFLKTDAPFWKKETTAEGAEHWVEAKPADDAARDRWR